MCNMLPTLNPFNESKNGLTVNILLINPLHYFRMSERICQGGFYIESKMLQYAHTEFEVLFLGLWWALL